MKNKTIKLAGLFIVLGTFLINCRKTDIVASNSVVTKASFPQIVEVLANSSYILPQNSGMVFTTIPDTIAIVVDSTVGYADGFGGVTGKDTSYILKSDILSWPDTTGTGSYKLTFVKYSNTNPGKLYNLSVSVTVLIPVPNPNPGPTDISGTYARSTNGNLMTIVFLSPGLFIIDNPGAGAPGTQLQPYLLYDSKNVSGNDSLSFSNQTNPCGGGLRLVSPTAALGLASSDYDAYPPSIVSITPPITLSWIALEFSSTDPSSIGVGGLCQWGTSVRTVIHQ